MSDELNFPEDLKYTDEHIWVRKEADCLVMGITDFAQTQLGEVVFVELPEPGDEIGSGNVFGSIESFKAVSELFMPLDGEIFRVNNALEDEPTLVNTAPYTQGWIAEVTNFEESAFDALLSVSAHRAGKAL